MITGDEVEILKPVEKKSRKGIGGKKGRSGRPRRNLDRRIEVLEGMTIDEAIAIMDGKDKKKRFLLVKDLAGKVLARRIKVHGNGSGMIQIILVRDQNGKPKAITDQTHELPGQLSIQRA